MSEKKYLSGLYAAKKHERQADFVICKLKIKPQQLIDSLKEYASIDGYLSLQVLTPYQEDPDWPDKLNVKIDDQQRDKSGKLTPPSAPVSRKNQEEFEDDIPF